MTARDPIFAELDRLITAGLGDIPREPTRPLRERERETIEGVQMREFVRSLNSRKARNGWETRRRRRMRELEAQMRERMGR